MNILIFGHCNFGTIDVEECFKDSGYRYLYVESDSYKDRVNKDFDVLFEKVFEKGIENQKYDCVFTFNYSPIISNNCNKRNIPYISFVYDSPQVQLYSYTVINSCNYIFIFDKTQYYELKKEGISTVYYAPLAVNINRINRMINENKNCENRFKADISFVGSMYNEKHNLFDRLKNLPPYVSGYLDGIIQAQLKVYGYYFIEELLKPDIIDALQKSVPAEPNKDGVETTSYLYAYYFIARKLAELERKDLLSAVSKQFNTHLYTPNATPELPEIINCGPIDYYNHMPYVFNNSRINLNISLRSIRSGIPLRAMNIMGCNGFLLSNYQADFYDFFVPGEDMAVFESKEDLINKCDYYLEHDNERRQIAANGFGKVNEFHTYKVRLKEIFDVVF